MERGARGTAQLSCAETLGHRIPRDGVATRHAQQAVGGRDSPHDGQLLARYTVPLFLPTFTCS